MPDIGPIPGFRLRLFPMSPLLRLGLLGPERLQERRQPRLVDHPAAIGDAEDEGARASGGGVGDRHLRQPEIGFAAGEAKLPQAPVRTPLGDALRSLCGERVGRIAEEQEIRVLNLHGWPGEGERRKGLASQEMLAQALPPRRAAKGLSGDQSGRGWSLK